MNEISAPSIEYGLLSPMLIVLGVAVAGVLVEAFVPRRVRHTTQFVLAIYRTQLLNPRDMDNVKKVQAGYKVQPLSAFLKQPAPAVAPPIDFPKIDGELAKTNFFEYLDFALQFAPPGPDEKDIRAKLASIGVGPGKTVAHKDLSPEQKAEAVANLRAAFAEHQKQQAAGSAAPAGAGGGH